MTPEEHYAEAERLLPIAYDMADQQHMARAQFIVARASDWLAARVASAAADREAVERVRAVLDDPANARWTEWDYISEFVDRLRAALSVPTEAEGAS